MATQMPTFPSCYQLHPDALEDWQLCRAWLQTYWEPSRTECVAAAPITRFLLWTWDVRKKRLTEVVPGDLAPFERFLGNPTPKGRWVGKRGRYKLSEQWRPFPGALAGATIDTNMRYVQDLLYELATWGLADKRFIDTFTGIRKRRNLTLKQAIKSL